MANDQRNADRLKEELAQDRTDWAYDRTVFARERTYTAWVRTGLTLIAVGLGVTRVLRTLEPRWIVFTLGGLLACLGGATFVLSFWRYRQPLDGEDRRARQGVPTWMIGLFTLGLLAGTGLALWLLFQ